MSAVVYLPPHPRLLPPDAGAGTRQYSQGDPNLDITWTGVHRGGGGGIDYSGYTGQAGDSALHCLSPRATCSRHSDMPQPRLKPRYRYIYLCAYVVQAGIASQTDESAAHALVGLLVRCIYVAE